VGTFTIHYDHDTGIPTISAEHEITTICGLAYVHFIERTHQMNNDFNYNFNQMAEVYGARYAMIDKMIARMKVTQFSEPLYQNLNGYEKNFLNAYMFGLQTAKENYFQTNPLLFWLNNHGFALQYINHPQHEYMLMHFYSCADDWIKEIL